MKRRIGLIACSLGRMIRARTVLFRTATMSVQAASFLKTELAIILLCLLGISSLRAEVQDVRGQFGRENLLHQPKRPIENRMPPKHGQQPVETPGGVGWGYWFYNGVLLWTNFTVADYYIIAPPALGTDASDYLYLTTTCRAALGTESLIWYENQNQPAFWIFDWAVANLTTNSPWVVGMDNMNTAYPQYLTMRPDDFGNTRQMCHIRNGTYYLGPSGRMYEWENQVMLFNFQRGDWDLIYSHDYLTTNITANVGGGWGPIVETFGTYTNVNPIGFDLARLFQDGNTNSLWLTTANTYLENHPPWQLITQSPDNSFAVYAGAVDPDAPAISWLNLDAPDNQLVIGINSQPGRTYQLYSASSLSGTTWSDIGAPVQGDGERLYFSQRITTPAEFFKFGAEYNTGSLLVSVNTNAASFTLKPSGGLISSGWVITPNSNQWDKAVVALPPGSYTVTFGAVAGLPTPPAQNITISTAAITDVSGVY